MTYGIMQDRIADELARSDLTSQIQKAIQSAIRHYERRAFYFNEVRKTMSTSDGAEVYTSSEFPFLAEMPEIYSAKITINSTSKYQLVERDWDYIEAIQGGGSEGDPTDFAYYGKQLRLYPIPNTARDIIFSFVEKTGSLSATTDTNYWMTDGEELIRSRATRKLYDEVIKDHENAAYWRECEAEALLALIGETEGRNMTGLPRPSYF